MKDRIALRMVTDAEKTGKLTKDTQVDSLEKKNIFFNFFYNLFTFFI
jgi:hypothetical protein